MYLETYSLILLTLHEKISEDIPASGKLIKTQMAEHLFVLNLEMTSHALA